MNKDDVTGDGDEAVVREIALRYGTEQTGCLSRLCEARRGSIVAKATREAYAAGIARGRALGAREAEAALEVERDSWSGIDGVRQRIVQDTIDRLARRAERGTK